MGAGKTSVGRLLARSMAKEFHDCDHEIEHHTGASISLIFDIEGEQGFRTREYKMIDQLTQLENIVLATGGGAVLDDRNRQHLAQRGYVVYLKADIDQLYQRTKIDRSRPLLQTHDPRAKLSELLETREPLYTEIANIIVATDGHSLHTVVKKIIDKIEEDEK